MYVSLFYPNESSRQILMNVPIIKFHENPYGDSQVVPRWRMDMMKLIVAFCNYVKAPKMSFTSRPRSNQYSPSRKIHKVRVYVTLMYTDK